MGFLEDAQANVASAWLRYSETNQYPNSDPSKQAAASAYKQAQDALRYAEQQNANETVRASEKQLEKVVMDTAAWSAAHGGRILQKDLGGTGGSTNAAQQNVVIGTPDVASGQYEQVAVRDSAGIIVGYTTNPNYRGVNYVPPALSAGQLAVQAAANTAEEQSRLQPDGTYAKVAAPPGTITNESIAKAQELVTGRAGYTAGALSQQAALEKVLATGATKGANGEFIASNRVQLQAVNEYQQSLQNVIEVSSAYHAWGKSTGLPVAPNPYEYSGDLALGLLKGTEGRSGAQITTPSDLSVLGMNKGAGVQEVAWQGAVTGQPQDYSVFVAPTNVLAKAMSEGQMGPYGALGSPYSNRLGENGGYLTLGMQLDIGYRAATSSFSNSGWKVNLNALGLSGQPGFFGNEITGFGSPYVELKPKSTQTTISAPTTYAGLTYTILPKDAIQPALPTAKEETGTRLSESWITGLPVFGGVIGWIPGIEDLQTKYLPTSKTSGFLGNIARDAAKPITTDVNKATLDLSKMGVSEYGADYTRKFINSDGTTTSKADFMVYSEKENSSNFELFQRGIVDASYGKFVPETPTDNALVLGVYQYARNRPLDIIGLAAATVVGGYGYKTGKAFLGGLKASAATGTLPFISTIGRAASTPIATDIFAVGETAFGGVMVGAAGLNIINQPTEEKKGEAIAETAIAFAGFGWGASGVKAATPTNYYQGREFFSGRLAMSPIEKATFKLETTLRGVGTSDRAAYGDVATVIASSPTRFIEPSVKAEPVFGELSRAGPYAKEIRTVLTEQPSSVIGSASVKQQYPANIVESAGIRTGKDADAVIQNPQMATQRLTQLTGLSESEAGAVLDVHPIPNKYPGLTPSGTPEVKGDYVSPLSELFGNPYRKVATPRGTSEVITPGDAGYTGELTYEAVQVQLGRKASAVSDVIENPITKGYRAEKDVYDFVSTYEAQKEVAITTSTPASEFAKSDAAMRDLMGREITLGTVKGQRTAAEAPTKTTTFGEIVETARQQVKAKSSETFYPDEPVNPGYVSSAIKSAPSTIPGAMMASGGLFVPSSELSQIDLIQDISPSVPSKSQPSSLWTFPSRLAAPSAATSPFMVSSPAAVPQSLPTSPIKMESFITSPVSAPPSSPVSAPPSSPYTVPVYGGGPYFSPPSPPSQPTGSTYQPPSNPQPPVFKVPGVPGMPQLNGGGMPSPFGRKRKAAFVELFPVGLDIGFMGRSPVRAKAFTSPKPRAKPARTPRPAAMPVRKASSKRRKKNPFDFDFP